MSFNKTVLALALTAACAIASATTLRIANQGDAMSMDPHSLNESLQLTFTGNVYEPLVGRDKKMGLDAGAGHGVDPDLADGVALRTAQGRHIPRRHAVHGRRRGVHLQARLPATART